MFRLNAGYKSGSACCASNGCRLCCALLCWVLVSGCQSETFNDTSEQANGTASTEDNNTTPAPDLGAATGTESEPTAPDPDLETPATTPEPTLSPATSNNNNPHSIPLAQTAGIQPTSRSAASVDVGNSLFVDTAQGSDSQNGALSSPFKTLAFAFTQLDSGKTLYIREGTYFENNLEITQSGNAGSPVRITNYPGENVLIDGSIQSFHNTNAGNWELYDVSSSTYRSVSSAFGDDLYTGYVVDGENAWKRLITYDISSVEQSAGLADLTATTDQVAREERYVGPGIFNDAGRLYIRLTPVSNQTVHNIGDTGVGVDINPNSANLSIAPTTPVLRIASSHVEISGLSITGSAKGILLESTASDITLTNNRMIGMALAIQADSGVSNVVVDHCEFDARFPEYLAWTDMKGTDGQTKPGAHWINKSVGFSSREINSLTMSNNYFNDTFDGLVFSGANIDIFGNAGFFVDDFAQIGSDSVNVRIHENRIKGAGPSHYGRGSSSNPGTIYIYKNVIDTSTEILWGKSDPDTILRDSYSGWLEQKPVQSHAKSAVTEGDPWKIYNNTIIFGSAASGHSLGVELFGDQNTTGVDHEVYNNIFVSTDGGTFVQKIDMALAGQIYDGNIYWSQAPTVNPVMASIKSAGGNSASFLSLSDFLTSAFHTESTSANAQGWETNGLQADPLLSESIIPSLDGPAATQGITLPSHFPGAHPQFRGAIAPAED